MSTWHLIASCLLLTVVAVHGRTTIPPPTGCTDSVWNVSANTNVLNGVGNAASTVDACKAACTADTTCLGFDWDPATTPMCWWTGSWSGSWRIGTATGVTHYQIVQRGTCTTSQVCISWPPSADKNVRGGTYQPGVTTLDGCKQACLSSASCVGIDWDPSNPSQQLCWLSPGTTLSDAPGVTHYNLVKSSSDQCTATGACALMLGSGGVLATRRDTDPRTVKVDDDIFNAIAFREVPCLDKTILASFNNCVSYVDSSDGVSYLRAGIDCRLHLSQPNGSIIDRHGDRFAQDTSFLRKNDPSGSGYFSLETASAQDYYVNGGAVSKDPVSWSGSNAFFCSPPSFLPLDPPALNKESCPLVWGRFRDSDINPLLQSMPSKPDLLDCARDCITRPQCAGISFKDAPKCIDSQTTPLPCAKSVCSLLVGQSATQPYTQHRVNYTYYEVQRSMTGTCDSGCSYAWKYGASLGSIKGTNGTLKEDECRNECIKAPDCVGITYAGTICTLYNTTGTTYGFALIRVYDRCGVCINSFGTVINATDVNAKSVGTANNRQCRTACINNPKCRGYEVHFDDGNCYLSLAPSVLTYPSPYLHSDIIRALPLCGNGCLFDWRSYQYTSMVNVTGVSVAPATNEKGCREACQNNAACTSVDWTPPSTCWLALIPDVPLNSYGTTPGTTHFELNREKCA